MKKLLSMMMFFSYFISFSPICAQTSEKIFQGIVVAGGLGITYVTVSYLCHRESNDVKIHRALRIWDEAASSINTMYSLKDIQAFLHNYQHLHVPVKYSYAELSARYMSWVKPWNWTRHMKEALQKITILWLLFENKEIFFALSSGLEEQKLLKLAYMKQSLGSSYPINTYVFILQNQIKQIEHLSLSLSWKWGSVVQDVLQQALNIIASSEQYVQERRLLEEMQLRERAVKAQETKAFAAAKQANVAEARFWDDWFNEKK